jgi:protein-serine/threonine kinase
MRSKVHVFATELVAAPYDPRVVDRLINDESGILDRERDILKQFVRAYGRKEKKRPRDPLLREEGTRKIVMAQRKKLSFMGYTWRRRRPYGYGLAYADPAGSSAGHWHGHGHAKSGRGLGKLRKRL